MEKLCVASFLANGHAFHLYSSADLGPAPAGVTLKDARDILPASQIFKYRDHDFYAGFSDFFRYRLLLERGGWWTDLDVICLKSFTFDGPYVFSSEEREHGREHVNCGVIKAPPNAPIMQYLWDRCAAVDVRSISWGEVGPELMKDAVEKYPLQEYVTRAHTFCPLHMRDFVDIFIPKRINSFGCSTYGVHLWHEFWRGNGLDKNEDYAPRCLYERLKDKYLRGCGGALTCLEDPGGCLGFDPKPEN